MYWIRWILFIPGAFLGSYVVHVIVIFVNRTSMINPDSFFGMLFILPAASLAMGASFVYLGTYIAPEKKKTVALVLGGMLLIITGFLLFPAIMMVDVWSIVGAVAMNIGSVGVVLSVFRGEIDSLTEKK